MDLENTKENQGKNDEALVYEVSYLLLPQIAESEVISKIEAIKKEIAELGGAMISDENPVLIELAYPMVKAVGATRHKVSSGYFGWLKFEMQKNGEAGVPKVKKILDENKDIVRYLLINTVRENTLLNGKMKFQKEEKTRDDLEDGEVVEDVSVLE